MSNTAFVWQTGVSDDSSSARYAGPRDIFTVLYGLEVSGYVRNTKKIVLYHFAHRERHMNMPSG